MNSIPVHIAILFVSVTSFLLPHRLQAGETEKLPITSGPMVGAVFSESAMIWLRSETTYLKLKCYPKGHKDRWVQVAFASHPEDKNVKLGDLHGLTPNTRYEYLVRKGGTVYASGEFRTPPNAGGPQYPFTVAVASCANQHSNNQQLTWNEANGKADLLLFLGDFVYPDRYEEQFIAKVGDDYGRGDYEKHIFNAKAYRDFLHKLYLKQHSVPSLRSLISRTATLAIWDDHEFLSGSPYFAGPTDRPGGRSQAKAATQALEVFRQMWRNPSFGDGRKTDPSEGTTSGVWYKYDWGDVRFLMLDTRAYRKRTESVYGMLGKMQMNWLTTQLEDSKDKTFVVISSGSCLRDGGDSWDKNQKTEMDHIMSEIRRFKLGGVLWVSGDIHRCKQVTHEPSNQWLNYPLHEIISSGVGLSPGSDNNLALLEFHMDLSDPEIRISFPGTGSVDPVQPTIKRSSLNP